jgi:hypothetical protein
MTLDTTIPLWSVISLLFTPIAGLIWTVITLHFKTKVLETNLKEAQEDIKILEASINTEIKTIHTSINEINACLRELNNYVKLLVDGRINTDSKSPIK